MERKPLLPNRDPQRRVILSRRTVELTLNWLCIAQQERSRISGSAAADFDPPLRSPTPIGQTPGADDSGHLHRLSQCGYQGGSPLGQASQVDLLTVRLAIFPTTEKDAHPFER